jgi:tetratricopeptide (TPR) repeat protein
MAPALVALLAAPQPAAPRPSATAEAERLAEEARALADRDPAGALARARRALALTAEFVPTEFVRAGRKGEVVEDEFRAAREEYRRHRALVYEAAGEALARQGHWLPASRYLRRAFELDPRPDRGLALARSLNELGRGREALATVQRAISGLVGLLPEAGAVIARAADVAGLPSAQAEIDRGRLSATLGAAVQLRDGPFQPPAGVRLSTTPVFRLDDADVNLLYAGEATCRHCSADLEELARALPRERRGSEGALRIRVLAVPPGDDQDKALRQVLDLYRRPWPLLLAKDVAARLALEPRSLLVVGRGGWTQAVLKAPFGPALGEALAAVQRTDVAETVPRPGWNRRPVDRSPLPKPPGLLPEGLAPGEDEPAPPEFTAAVAAFRAGRAAEARKTIDALEARGDGWLLPPEARLNRALCLARAGERDAARRILLRTGDSRFEDAIDQLLETVAGARTAN